MLRSRVLTSIDVSRLADAVARPGIDPRTWVSYAVCTSEPYFETTAGQQDCFVDIYLMPSGVQETARVGSIYAGNGFGLWTPLHKDDEVLVCAPSGDPDEGLVVTQRLWSPSDPPPQEAADNADDVVLMVEEGRSVRIGVRGGGTVRLGQVEASRGVARIDDPVAVYRVLTTTVVVVTPTPPAGTCTRTLFTPDGLTILGVNTLVPWTGVPPIEGSTETIYGSITAASETVFAS